MFGRSRDDYELDPRALMLPLSPAQVGHAKYTAVDRYRDFRAVLVDGDATPLQRERVLFQIFALTGLHAPVFGDSDAETYRQLGRRDVGLDLMKWLSMPPNQDGRAVTTIHTEGDE